MAPPIREEVHQGSSVETLGFYCLYVFVFGMFSAVFDLVRPLGALRPALVCGSIGLLVILINGRLAELLKHTASRALIALTAWWIVCVPFSVWPGGAIKTLINQWYISALTFFIVSGLLKSGRQCLRIAYLIGFSGIILSVATLKIGYISSEGRLGLPATRYGNPNDLGLVLLTTLPFLGLMIFRHGNIFRRTIALAGVLPILLAISKTGSRSAVIGAAAALIVLLAHLTMANRVKLILALIAVTALLVPFVPEHLRERYATILDEQVESDSQNAVLVRSSIESSASRMMLLKDSITVTFKYPIFGVGTGMFPVAQDQLARARGERMGNWHVTHNTYTEVSSESGIIGLTIYLVLIFQALRSLSRAVAVRLPYPSSELADIQLVAIAMRIAMSSFLTSAFFGSVAYLPFLYVFIGISVALEFNAIQLVSQAHSSRTPRKGMPPQPAARPVRAGAPRPLSGFPRPLPGKA